MDITNTSTKDDGTIVLTVELRPPQPGNLRQVFFLASITPSGLMEVTNGSYDLPSVLLSKEMAMFEGRFEAMFKNSVQDGHQTRVFRFVDRVRNGELRLENLNAQGIQAQVLNRAALPENSGIPPAEPDATTTSTTTPAPTTG